MIRHIVMWKFRSGTETEQERFLEGLRSLQGVIPQLRRSEVARSVGTDNYDAVLVSEFDTLADLELYKNDPRHKAVLNACAPGSDSFPARIGLDSFHRRAGIIRGTVPSGLRQIHGAIAAKGDALCFQQRPLGARGQDIKAGLGAPQTVHHPVTGNRLIPAGCQGIAHHAGAAGHPGQTGNLAVCGGFAGGDLPDCGVDAGKGPGWF